MRLKISFSRNRFPAARESHVKKADLRQAARPRPATKPKPRQEAQMKVLPHAPRVKAAVHARVRRARHASAPDRQQPENFAGPPNHLSLAVSCGERRRGWG